MFSMRKPLKMIENLSHPQVSSGPSKFRNRFNVMRSLGYMTKTATHKLHKHEDVIAALI